MIADKALALAGTLIQWCIDALDAAIWESRETTAEAAAGQGVPAGQGLGDRFRYRLRGAEGKPTGFLPSRSLYGGSQAWHHHRYLTHPPTVHDSIVYLGRLDRQTRPSFPVRSGIIEKSLSSKIAGAKASKHAARLCQ